jgi:hypothetical protein
MHTRIRYLTMLLASTGACAAIAAAPIATAAPQCTNTGPTTMMCQTNGSSQIVTSPPINNNWYGGWPWGGGLVIGLGGGGWGFGW